MVALSGEIDELDQRSLVVFKVLEYLGADDDIEEALGAC